MNNAGSFKRQVLGDQVLVISLQKTVVGEVQGDELGLGQKWPCFFNCKSRSPLVILLMTD